MRALKKKPIQIYIEPKQDTVLEALSKKQGVSKAEIIRLSLDKFMAAISYDDDPATSIIGLGSSKKGDLSKNHNRYLVKYSRKRKR